MPSYFQRLSFCLFFLTIITAHASNKDNETSATQTIDRIVLITLDTFRADHLKVYGYPRETAPFITSLANQGVLFKRFIAASSLTSPAHATMFTSRYPLQHNLLKNSEKLDDKFFTLAEMMQSAGLQTAGFASTDIHFKIGNMDQGFDVFNEMERQTPKYPTKIGKREQVITVAKPFKYRPASQTIDKAISWLETKKGDDNFFLWVHLFDAHMPHQAPKKFIDSIKEESAKERSALAKFLFESQKINLTHFSEHKKNQTIPEFIDNYDAEIRYIDSELQRLYQSMQTASLNTNTLWVIAADHGEGLGNHHYLGHDRNIYNEQLHIPLIFHFSSSKLPGRTVDHVVSHIDILPTFADLVSFDLSEKTPAIEGQSLLPLIQNNSAIFSSSGALSYKKKSELPPLSVMQKESPFSKKIKEQQTENKKHRHSKKPKTQEEWKSQVSEKIAFQTQHYKYIYNTEFDDEFYDLSKDPYETTNLFGQGLKQEREFRKKIRTEMRRLKRSAKTNTPQKPLDEKTVEKLRSLGYIQ